MTIVVLEPQGMGDAVRHDLDTLGEVAYGPFQAVELGVRLAQCNVLMVRLGHYIGRDLFAQAPRLRYIVSATTGLDHIDLTATAERGIRVISLRDCPDQILDVSAAAEHTWGLVLALTRRTVAAAHHVLEGGWDRDRFWGVQLAGKRLGIVGCGRIGRQVAGYGAAFGLQVVACDPNPSTLTPPVQGVSFGELLSTADIITIHAMATPENHHLLDVAAVAALQQGAYVINTARGSLVDETALADAVTEGRIAGVAVDVIDGEERGRASESPLLACARRGFNVVITPHIGGAAREAIAQTERAVVACLERVVRSSVPPS